MLYNIKIKRFNKNIKQITTYSREIISRSSPMKGRKRIPLSEQNLDPNQLYYKIRRSNRSSTSRTVNKIYDIARSNTWEWFVTFTFDPEKTDSYDYSICSKRLKNWIDNELRGSGLCVKYLAVPELHKSGRFHFHMLLSGSLIPMVDSGKVTKTGLTIYNLGTYHWGFTTAIEIYDTNGISKYLSKYITKDLTAVTKGKKRYWASRTCELPKVETYYTRHLETNEEIYSNMHGLEFTKSIDRKDTEGKIISTIKYFEIVSSTHEQKE